MDSRQRYLIYNKKIIVIVGNEKKKVLGIIVIVERYKKEKV